MDTKRSPNGQNEIVIKDLAKNFGDVTAVNGLNLKIGKGELFGLLGPNGAGKTTTISMLCGLLAPSAGSAQIAGFDIRKDMPKIKERIGVCPQEAAVGKTCPRSRNASGSALRKLRSSIFSRGRRTSNSSGTFTEWINMS